MSTIFYKYQGTGNDFIIIDNRSSQFNKNNTKRVSALCDRRFGIGADGLILLENDDEVDFKMVYYNSDGNESTMCGNGGRCITAFANMLGIISENAVFRAIDGLHQSRLEGEKVYLQMQDVDTVKINDSYVYLDTGSPHHVTLVNDVEALNIKSEGALIRYSDLYGKDGCNINFVQQVDETQFKVRTYERGVEDETLSCGTGVTAVAIAMSALNKTNKKQVELETPGGELSVKFSKQNDSYSDIWLIGPATFVYKGEIQ
ncbi:MAG: diaminopimelate epimerase [Winogradskyella sp.]|nr:diaminopimelate epimerase [Winogradskyella sp.]